jgi:vanillate O-demethylase monooxygenase subunit
MSSAVSEWASSGDRALLERCWLPVGFEDSLDSPRPATVLGRSVVVYRGDDGSAVVAADRCPHRGAQLSAGAMVDGDLRCAYHGWRFGAAGQCTRVPSQPCSVAIPSRANLAVLPSTTFGGLVWCRLNPEPALAALPDWPESTDASFRHVHPPAQQWATSAGRQVENFLDVSHFAFVHAGTFGESTDPIVADIDVEVSAGRLVQRFDFLASNPNESPLGGDEATVQRRMTYQVDLPYCSRLEIAYDDGRRDVVLLASAPVTSEVCEVFVIVARNYDHDRPAEELLAWDVAILEEDRPIIEGQRPKVLPLELVDEVSVKADRATIAYRRALRAMGFVNG